MKVFCFDVVFYLPRFSHFVALCTRSFLWTLIPKQIKAYEKTNLSGWIIDFRGKKSSGLQQQPLSNCLWPFIAKLCFVVKSNVNACSCSALAFEVFTLEINNKFSFVRNDWLNAWFAGFQVWVLCCHVEIAQNHITLFSPPWAPDVCACRYYCRSLAMDLSDISKAQG